MTSNPIQAIFLTKEGYLVYTTERSPEKVWEIKLKSAGIDTVKVVSSQEKPQVESGYFIHKPTEEEFQKILGARKKQ